MLHQVECRELIGLYNKLLLGHNLVLLNQRLSLLGTEIEVGCQLAVGVFGHIVGDGLLQRWRLYDLATLWGNACEIVKLLNDVAAGL